jgi:tol-pal system protein YbgF
VILQPARIAALLSVAASACWVPVERGQQMEERIQRLEAENALNLKQLEEQRAVMRERVVAADEKIAEVQKKLVELNAVAHRSGADLAVNQDRLQEESRALRGKLEEAQHRLELVEQAMAALRSDTEGKFAALKGAGALDEYEARKKAADLKRPTDKASFLALAQKQEQAGEKGVARELYEEYVRKWPADPRAADARFRLGEIAFGEKRYREAVLAFGKVVQDFPRSDKAPDSLLRAAESMLALDLNDDAKAMFREVVSRFPKSSAARKAKARLAELSAGQVKKKAPKK